MAVSGISQSMTAHGISYLINPKGLMLQPSFRSPHPASWTFEVAETWTPDHGNAIFGMCTDCRRRPARWSYNYLPRPVTTSETWLHWKLSNSAHPYVLAISRPNLSTVSLDKCDRLWSWVCYADNVWNVYLDGRGFDNKMITRQNILMLIKIWDLDGI